MSAEAASLIADIIVGEEHSIANSLSLRTVPPLNTFHFFNNMSGDGGAKAIARIIKACGGTLNDIRFSATRSMEAGCAAIANVRNDVCVMVNLLSIQSGLVIRLSLLP